MRGAPVPGTGKSRRLRGLHRWRRWNQNHWPGKGRWRYGTKWYDEKDQKERP